MQIDQNSAIYVTLPVDEETAKLLGVPVGRNADGSLFCEKRVLFAQRSTKYRGEVLICIKGKEGAEAYALAELEEVKPASRLSEDEWRECTSRKKKRGYGYILGAVRRVVPISLPAQDLLDIVLLEDTGITPYPQNITIGREGWGLILEKLHGN